MQILNSADTVEKIRKNETSVSDTILTENLKYIVDDANYIRSQRIISGAPPLRLPFVNSIKQLILKGTTVQNGTPTPTAPIMINGVGNIVTATNKYIIPVNVGGLITNINVDLPLMRDEILYSDGTLLKLWDRVYLKNLRVSQRYDQANHSTSWYFGINGDCKINTATIPYCSHLRYSSTSLWSSETIAFQYSTVANEPFRVRIPKTIANTIDELTQWFNTSNAYIDFMVSNPATQQIQVPAIISKRGTNIIKTETEVQPTNITVLY